MARAVSQDDDGPRTVSLLFVLKGPRVSRGEPGYDLQYRLQVQMLEHERRERSIGVLSRPSAQVSHLVLGEELDHPCERLPRHRDETEPIGVHVPLDESAEGLVRQETDADSFPLRPLAELAVDRFVDSKRSCRSLSTLQFGISRGNPEGV